MAMKIQQAPTWDASLKELSDRVEDALRLRRVQQAKFQRVEVIRELLCRRLIRLRRYRGGFQVSGPTLDPSPQFLPTLAELAAFAERVMKEGSACRS